MSEHDESTGIGTGADAIGGAAVGGLFGHEVGKRR